MENCEKRVPAEPDDIQICSESCSLRGFDGGFHACLGEELSTGLPLTGKLSPKSRITLGQSLKLAIWDIGALVLFNVLLFTAAYVSFLKYDVR